MPYLVKNGRENPDLSAFRRDAFQAYQRMAQERTRFLARHRAAEGGESRHQLARFSLLVLMASDLAEFRRVPMVPLEQFVQSHISPRGPKGYLDQLMSQTKSPAENAAAFCRRALRTGLCGWPGFSQEAFDRGLPQSDEFLDAFREDYQSLRMLAFELGRLSEGATINGKVDPERRAVLDEVDRALLPALSAEQIQKELKHRTGAEPNDDGPLPA